MDLKNIQQLYFIGIGGIGMSALVRYFHAQNYTVAGYDKTPSPVTEGLVALGVNIHFEDDVDLIPVEMLSKATTLIVYTPAIPKNHKEYIYFVENGFTLMKRAEILGLITKNSFCFAVAGTHGKTTTSTLLGHILTATGINATSFLGGISENYQSNLILGGDEVSVVEADEFDRSFMQLAPNIACITSMDADHLDIYGDAECLSQTFIDFSRLVKETLFVRKGLPLQGITYGIEDGSDYEARNIRAKNGVYFFEVHTPKGEVQAIELPLSGRHNVLNTVVALAMAHSYGVELHAIADALKTFKGVQRRFNYKIHEENLVLIDDYAHHPTEINAVAQAVREMFPGKKIAAVFQPHLFTRTRDFIDEFALSLAKFDSLLLLDIYPAREKPISGVNAGWLLEKVDLEDKKIVQKQDVLTEVKASGASVIVMLGAGDIGLLVEEVKKGLLAG
ncbi:UDP-N-acetylmuramate--L-alanine ligase [Flavobacteriaceae bacterium F08102]|nr:UDP-N-acetylmuramate--L-alanine ligase [Flavobacteriaceae bacterium F08102]